ncbi:MAG: TOBE domain-containing protein [Actinobacteria bacterium]|nr:TOBE domain-containing protein [Actinomycetota bacterium]
MRLTTAESGFAVEVDLVEVLGADAYVYGGMSRDDGTRAEVTVRTDGRTPPRRGETVFVSIDATQTHAFDAGTGVRLGD